MFQNNNVLAAREFAVRAHGEQKYGEHPYVYHLEAVARLLEPFGKTAQVVGYLHDVLEDTQTTFPEILRVFGQHAAIAVTLVTDEPGINRKERKAATNRKLAAIKEYYNLALAVKAADRLANIRESAKGGDSSKLGMYRREHGEFMKAAYRPGLCDSFWDEMAALLNG